MMMMNRRFIPLVAGLLLGCVADPDSEGDSGLGLLEGGASGIGSADGGASGIGSADGGASDIGLADGGGRMLDAADGGREVPLVDGGACEMEATAVLACAAADPRPENFITGDLNVVGVVGEIGHEESKCEPTLSIGRSSYPKPSGLPWSFWVTDANAPGREVLVWMHAEGIEPPVRMGDVVSVEYRMLFDALSGRATAHLTVRGQSGDLLFWIGEGWSPGRLGVPDEIVVEPGRILCGFEEICTTVERATLLVTVDGETVEVGYGARVEIGDYLVVHAGQEQPAELAPTNCGDWSPHHTAFLVTRR